MAIINGTDGNDTLRGSSANDTMNGFGGDDWIDGGGGADVYIFAPGHGNDTVIPYDDAYDKADLSAFGERAPTYAQLLAATREVGNDVLFDLSAFGGGTIRVPGVTIADLELAPSDFIGLSDTPYSPPAPTNPSSNTSPWTIILRPDSWDDGPVRMHNLSERDTIDLSVLGAQVPTYAQLLAASRNIPTADNQITGVEIDLSAFGGGVIRITSDSTQNIDRVADLNPSMFIGLSESGMQPTPEPIPDPTPNTNPDTTERGGSGNDTLNGSPGNDNVYGEGGNDALLGGEGNDYIAGSEGNDHIWGQAGNDAIDGGTGDDLIFGQTGNDTIAGGAGGDIILSGDDDDAIAGNAGDDGIWAEDGNDAIDGGTGIDFLAGGTGNDTLNGGADADYLTGESGNDTVIGGAGYDMLLGGEGNDRIEGGAEGDTYFGQEGADTFVIRGGTNWVMDFDSVDRLSIGMNLSQVQGAATQLGDHLHVALANGGDLYLALSTIADIEADNLIV